MENINFPLNDSIGTIMKGFSTTRLPMLVILLIFAVCTMGASEIFHRPTCTESIPGIRVSLNYDKIVGVRGGSIESRLRKFVRISIRKFMSLFKKSSNFKHLKTSSRKFKTTPIMKKTIGSSKPISNTGVIGSSRIMQEMQRFIAEPPENCKLDLAASNAKSWTITMVGVNGTVFSGEVFKLRMIFSSSYPSKPPSVFFLPPCPKHAHVYSNGDICLSILGRDWRPMMSAHLLTTSILSMLSSAREKKVPEGNAHRTDVTPGQQQDDWMYHDDKC